MDCDLDSGDLLEAHDDVADDLLEAKLDRTLTDFPHNVMN